MANRRIVAQDLSQANIIPQATIRDTYIQQGVKKSQTLYDLAMLQDVLPVISKAVDMRAELEAEQKVNEALATDGIEGLKKLNKEYKGLIPGVYTPLAKARTSQALARRAVDLEKNAISELTNKYTEAAAAGVDLELPFEEAVKQAREGIRKDLHPDLATFGEQELGIENFYYSTEYNKHSAKLQGKVEDVGFQIDTLKKQSKAKLNLYQDVGNALVGGGTSNDELSRVDNLTQIATEAFEAGVPNVGAEMFAETKSQLTRMAAQGRSQEALAILIELADVKIGPVSFSEGDNRDAYNSLFSKLATSAESSEGDEYLAQQRDYKLQVEEAYSKPYMDEEGIVDNPVFLLTKATNAREVNKLIEDISNMSQEELASIGVSWEARKTLIDSAREQRASISAMGSDNQKERTFTIKERIQAGDIESARTMLQTPQDRITFREEVDKKYKIDREADNNKDAGYLIELSQTGLSEEDRNTFGDKGAAYEEQDRNWAEINLGLVRQIAETEDPVEKNKLREELQQKVFQHKQESAKRKEDFLERRRKNDETISKRVMEGVPLGRAVEGLDMTAQERATSVGRFSGLESAVKSSKSAYSDAKLEKEAKDIIENSFDTFAGDAMGVGLDKGYVDDAGGITENGVRVQQVYVENVKTTMQNWVDANSDLLFSDPEKYSKQFTDTLNRAKVQYNPLFSDAPTSVVPRVKPTKKESSETTLTTNEQQFQLYENARSSVRSLEEYSNYTFDGSFSDDLVNSFNIETSSKESIQTMSASSNWNNDLMRAYVRHSAVNEGRHTSFWSEEASGTLVEDSGLIPQQLIDLAVIQARDTSDSPEGTNKLNLIKMLSVFNRAYSNEEIKQGLESGKYPEELAEGMYWEVNQEYVPIEVIYSGEGSASLYDNESDSFSPATVIPQLDIVNNFDYRRTRTFTNVDDLYEFVYNSGQFDYLSDLLGVDANTFFKAQKNLLNQ